MTRLAAAMLPEDVQLYYQIGLMGRRDLELGPDPRSGFEMLVLRMLAFRPADTQPQAGAAPGAVRRGISVPGAVSQAPSPRETPSRHHEAVSPAPAVRGMDQDQPPGAAAAPVAIQSPDEWAALVGRLGLNGMAREFALHCAVKSADAEHMKLVLDVAHKHLLNNKMEQRIEQALQASYGPSFRLEVSVGDETVDTPASVQKQRQSARERSAQASVEADATIKALKDTFNARIVPDSIRPAD